jgi:hypothetical protein
MHRRSTKLQWWVKVVVAVAVVALGLSPTGAFNTIVHAAETSMRIKVMMAPIQFLFGDQALAPPTGQEGFIVNGTTYVPLRFMSNALEQKVQWDIAANAVYVDTPSTSELAKIQAMNKERLVTSDNNSISSKPASTALVTKTITVHQRSITYVFGGVEKQPPAGRGGIIHNNLLYVPLRFFGESLGRTIGWDAKSLTIAVAPIVSTMSYETIVTASTQQMDALIARCKMRLSSMADQYFAAKTDAQRTKLLLQGQQELDACDASFDNLLNSTQLQLSANGHSTAIITQYRARYDALKQAEMDRLLGMVAQ